MFAFLSKSELDHALHALDTLSAKNQGQWSVEYEGYRPREATTRERMRENFGLDGGKGGSSSSSSMRGSSLLSLKLGGESKVEEAAKLDSPRANYVLETLSIGTRPVCYAVEGGPALPVETTFGRSAYEAALERKQAVGFAAFRGTVWVCDRISVCVGTMEGPRRVTRHCLYIGGATSGEKAALLVSSLGLQWFDPVFASREEEPEASRIWEASPLQEERDNWERLLTAFRELLES